MVGEVVGDVFGAIGVLEVLQPFLDMDSPYCELNKWSDHVYESSPGLSEVSGVSPPILDFDFP